ncbi:acyltransferase family protein [Rouxiella sp. Mn2063]|uniref:acyltransferase family protein n=1 Tax=Rouxiella sp. Mn2063 TaxID=3395262 RepID=UPI003BDE0876
MSEAVAKIKHQFDSIDILRGFAAISVVVYHVIEHMNWKEFPTTGILSWFRYGWMGVDLFFVISGFVISLSAFNQINKNGSHHFKREFLSRRVRRIVPLHYLTLFIFIAFISPTVIFNHFFTNLVSHLLFIHNTNYDYHGAINGSNWSLGAEMQFYILIALTAQWLKNVKWWVLAGTALLISYSWRFAAFSLVDLSQPLGVFKLFVSSTQLPGMLDEFAAGILLARLVTSEIGAKILSYKYASKIILLIASIVICYLSFSVYFKYASFWQYPYMVVFFRTAIAISAATILLFLCTIKAPKYIKLVLSPFYYLGTISYGIYLWHLPILLSIKKIEWLSHSQALVIILSMTLVMSSLSWHFFEKKFILKN